VLVTFWEMALLLRIDLIEARQRERQYARYGLLLFYQKFYGTTLYFFTYLFNRRYEGHSRAAVWTFVGGINGIWLVLPALGLYACVRLLLEGSFDVFWR
jgi:hypothetical protein